MKRCSKCKTKKEDKEFHNDKRYKSGLYPSCKKCRNKLNKKWRNKNKEYYKKYQQRRDKQPYIIFAKKKANAKIKGIKFEITKEEFINWYNKQKKDCIYCGVSLEDIRNKRIEDSQLLRTKNLTIDKLKPKEGYVLNNIVLCCARCNLIKNDFFDFKEMKEIGKKYVKPKRV